MLRIFRKYYPIRNFFFVFGEFILISVSVLIAAWIVLEDRNVFLQPILGLKVLLISAAYQICFYYCDLYNLQVTNSYSELSTRLLQSIGSASILLSGVYFVFPKTMIGPNIFFISLIFAPLFVVIWRFFYTIVLDKGWFNEKIILLGSSDLAKDIISEIGEKKDSGYSILLVIAEKEDDVFFQEMKAQDIACRCGYEKLSRVAAENGIKKIIVAIKQRRGAFPARELLDCRVRGINIVNGNSFYEMLTGKLIVEQINPAWLIFSSGFRISRRKRILKRVIDLALSLTLLVLLAPLTLVTALLIKIDSRGPVIFSQERVGQRRRAFSIYKFRSMVKDAEKRTGPVWAQDDDSRVTRVGKVIRLLRIDEIPQLWNILKGEMSFVGPRPEREFFVTELEKQIPYYGERFMVKPGLTGWAQVRYHYGASVEDAIEKLNYDLFYTKNFSILMDLMIVFQTIKIVLFGKGAR